jgi:hypothetical protein
MGRLAILVLPLLAACGFASAEAHAPGSTTIDEPEDARGVLGDNLDRPMGARVQSLTDPFANPLYNQGGFGLEHRWVKDFDVQIATAAAAPDPFSDIPRTSLTVPGASVTDPRPVGAAAPTPEAPPPAQQERQVLYTGSLALQVPDPEGLELEVSTIAKGYGGWVSKIERPRIVLRVPAARFEEAMKALSQLGQVLDRKISGQEVSDQFRDLRIRLENAEKLRARLAALLEQAKNVQDALAVEKELGRVTEEIERLKGQIAAMTDSVAFSAITLELRRSLPLAARQRRFPFPWVHRLGAESLFRF